MQSSLCLTSSVTCWYFSQISLNLDQIIANFLPYSTSLAALIRFSIYYTKHRYLTAVIKQQYNFRKMMTSAQQFEDSNERIRIHRKNLLSLLSLKRSILQYEKSPSQKQIVTHAVGQEKGSTVNIKVNSTPKNKLKQSKTIHTDGVSASQRNLEKKYQLQTSNQLSTKNSKLVVKSRGELQTKKQSQERVDLKKEINNKLNAMKSSQTAYEMSRKAASNQMLTKENVQNRVNLFIEKYKSSYRIESRKLTVADKQHQEIQRLANQAVNKLKDTNQSIIEDEEVQIPMELPSTQQKIDKARVGSTQDDNRGKSTLKVRPTIKARLQMKRQIQGKVLLKDRYQILQRIGRGLSGEVYKAKDILSDRLVAIKIITETLKKEEEYQFYKTIQHKNIVSYYNNFVFNGNRYLVLEYFPYTLHKLCKSRRLSQDEIRRIFRGIANGLMFLHGLSIAHRDIKLDNIVVSDDLADIKFIDFGLCIDLSKCQNQKTKQFCGTILYMSPEILQKRAYNPKKADIWSLGILLYRLLFNRFPFNSRNEFAMLQKIRKNKVVMGESCNVDLLALLQGMLNKNPSERFTILDVIDNKWIR